MKMLFLSPNQEVDCDKKEESYLLFYGDTTPPPPHLPLPRPMGGTETKSAKGC